MSSSPTTRLCCQRTSAHSAMNDQPQKPMWKYRYLLKPTVVMTLWSTWTAQSLRTCLVWGSQSSRVEGLFTKTVLPTESQPLVWSWRYKQSYRQYRGSPPSVTHTLHMPLFSQTQWICCKMWSLEWAAPKGTQPCTVFSCKDFCWSSALAMLAQQWSPEGEGSGDRKQTTFHPLRSWTVRVQQDKHWHCFKSNTGDTAETDWSAYGHYDTSLLMTVIMITAPYS